MYIFGVDPGTSKCGWCLYDSSGDEVIANGVIVMSGKPHADDSLERSIAITQLLEHNLTDLVADYGIDILAIEDQFIQHNARSAIKLTRLTGMIIYMAYNEFGLEVVLVPPRSATKIVPDLQKLQGKKPEYAKKVVQYVVDRYDAPLQGIDDAFAILIARAGVEQYMLEELNGGGQ